MKRVIEILEMYNQPKLLGSVMVVLIVSHLLLWSCVLAVKDEQLKRTGVIDMAKERILHAK